jgi:TPR repeat protein
MTLYIRRGVLVLAVAALHCGTGIAGLTEGVDAILKGDYAAALKELRPLAERGNSDAQYRLGRMYEFGRGVPMDKARALVWLRKSAAQENSYAEQELGVIYATGDGVKQDDAQAVAWFRKAAAHGNATGQYNLGLMYAKGNGVREDIAQAIAWFRKAAEQGDAGAQFKLGVAYENGEGVAQDSVLAYANYAIAARAGNKEYAQYRDDIGKKLTAPLIRQAQALADDWQVGKPTPASTTLASKDQAAATPASAASRPDKCLATGLMSGEKFSASHCAIALNGDQHSVSIWFNEDPITPDEVKTFQIAADVLGEKAGKQRTLLRVMFCPGGGATTASAAAVKTLDLSTNHARSMLAGIQRSPEAPKDFKVEKMTGEVKPGAMLTGRIVGALGKTTWNLDFDLKLPENDNGGGLICGKS